MTFWNRCLEAPDSEVDYDHPGGVMPAPFQEGACPMSWAQCAPGTRTMNYWDEVGISWDQEGVFWDRFAPSTWGSCVAVESEWNGEPD